MGGSSRYEICKTAGSLDIVTEGTAKEYKALRKQNKKAKVIMRKIYLLYLFTLEFVCTLFYVYGDIHSGQL